ncbi:MAG: hypothetical protein FGM39_11555, partial [Phycisphaerales bacterium]|nr:hypothetical protein [Phycisphaerales bacterium]
MPPRRPEPTAASGGPRRTGRDGFVDGFGPGGGTGGGSSGGGPGGNGGGAGDGGGGAGGFRGKKVTTCSFCGKTSREVGPMVEGPNDVYI